MIRAIAAGLLMVMLAGCDYVASLDAPLPQTEGAEIQDGLAGEWVIAQDSLVMVLTVEELPGEQLGVRLFATTYDPDDLTQGLPYAIGTWRGWPAVVDGRTYFVARLESVDYAPGGDTEMDAWQALVPTAAYHVARAHIAADGRLTLHLLAERDLATLDAASKPVVPDVPAVRITSVDPGLLREHLLSSPEETTFTWTLGPFDRIGDVAPR
ncbi:MAG: hypothetical protein AAF409_19335 [Pseudomonadota bacterium]